MAVPLPPARLVVRPDVPSSAHPIGAGAALPPGGPRPGGGDWTVPRRASRPLRAHPQALRCRPAAVIGVAFVLTVGILAHSPRRFWGSLVVVPGVEINTRQQGSASSGLVSRSRAMPVGGPHRENWPALQAVPALLHDRRYVVSLSRAVRVSRGLRRPPACGGLCRPPPGELARGRRSLACRTIALSGGTWFAALRAAVPTGGRRSKPSPRFCAIGGVRFRGGHEPRTREEPRGRMAPGFPFDFQIRRLSGDADPYSASHLRKFDQVAGHRRRRSQPAPSAARCGPSPFRRRRPTCT